MVLRRASVACRFQHTSFLAVRRATISATVDRSRATRSPSVRWSMLGSNRSAFRTANWGDVMDFETSSLHTRLSACCALRMRWPGCRERSSAGKSVTALTLLYLGGTPHLIADRH